MKGVARAPFNLSLTRRRDNAAMAKAIALARSMAAQDALPAPLDWLRRAIVCGCALTLICAGQTLPF